MYKFYGADPATCETVETEAFKRNRDAFFADASAPAQKGKKQQTAAEANEIFYGVDHKKRGRDIPQPIPGYSGTRPRQEADAQFGCTFAEGCIQAQQSLDRIAQERAETLKTQQKF